MLRRTLQVLVIAAAFGGLIACKTDGATPTTPQTPTTPVQPSGPTIALNEGSVQQTMGGWELQVLPTVRDYRDIVPFMSPLMDQAVNDFGLNRVALGIFPGVENSSGSCQQQYLDGVTTEAAFLRDCAYRPVNDNSDPGSINPNGFQWQVLDWQIDTMLLPMKRRLEARGEKLYVGIRYGGFGGGSYEPRDNPAEYAELVLALFEHVRSKYGFVPDGYDIINEPDQTSGWNNPALIGRVAAAVGARLEAAGFRPELTGPSTANKANAAPYFDTMMAQSGARTYLKELTWHCYNDTGTNTAATIAAKAVEYGVRTAQTECWTTGNNYQVMLQDLKGSRNSTWSMGPINAPNGYYSVESNGSITLRDRPKYMRQYFKYIRMGARRIAATASVDQLDPVAFINTDGRYVVVVKAAAASAFTITNLPAGRYGIYSTLGPDASTVSSFDVTAADQTVGSNGQLAASIQGAGVITIYAKGSQSGLAAIEGQGDAPAGLTAAAASALTASTDDGSKTFVTRDGIHLNLDWLARGVETPVDLAADGDGRLFIVEPTRVLVAAGGEVAPALQLQADAVDGQEELQSLVLDEHFASNHFVYTVSTLGAPQRTFRLARYVEAGNRLLNRVSLLEGIPARGGATAALRSGPDHTLLLALDDGGRPDAGADAGSFNGKVLRLNTDGTTPKGARAGSPVFGIGFAEPRGLAWDSAASLVWLAGWQGQGIIEALPADARTPPTRVSRFALPLDLAPVSMALYRSGPVALLNGNLFVASSEGRELLRLSPTSPDRTTLPLGERLFAGELGRVRAVSISDAGVIYLATDRGVGGLVPQP